MIRRQYLEQAGRAHAAADAHGDHAQLGAAAAALDQEMAGHARARHAIGMADGDGAAIHIGLGGVQPQPVHARTGRRA